MNTPEQTQAQVQAATRGQIIKQPITTKIPGWRRHEDKAKGLLNGWVQIVGLPAEYADAIFDWFDKADERWAFQNAEIALVDDATAGRCVQVCCEVEVGRKKFENAVHLFPLSELRTATGV